MDATADNTITVHGLAAIFVLLGGLLFVAVIFLGPGAGFALFILRWVKKAIQHRQDMVQFATARGLGYVNVDNRQTMRWARPPFHQGFNRQASNVVFGTFKGHDFFAFDYSFETQNDNGPATSTYAVCALNLPADLPYLEVGPESVFSRLENVVGVHDVEIESEDFNRKFKVRAADPKFASAVLTPSLAQTLLKAPAYHWRTENLSLVSWHPLRIKPAELDEWLATLAAIVDAVPAFVWHEYGAASPAASPDTSAAPQPVLVAAPAPAPAPQATPPQPPARVPLAAVPPAAVPYLMARPMATPIPSSGDILPGKGF